MRPVTRQLLSCTFAALVLVAAATAAFGAQGATPRPEVLQITEAVIAAVNGTNTAVDGLAKDFFTTEYQKKQTPEERRKWFEAIRTRHGKIQREALRREAPDTFIIIASGEKSGTLNIAVTHDEAYKVTNLDVRQPGQ
ncbi:MAG TPA: hypothetical protein VM364_12725 [Vicinamibacterales bacterium]|nr:hypothetical protein [Vicinamibacterales bacterium]